MSADYSRDMFVTFVLLSAIPMQAAALWVHPTNTLLDWLVMASLLALGMAHIDAKRPDPE